MNVKIEATEVELEKLSKVLMVPEMRSVPNPETGQPMTAQVLRAATKVELEDHLKKYLQKIFIDQSIQQFVMDKRAELAKQLDG